MHALDEEAAEQVQAGRERGARGRPVLSATTGAHAPATRGAAKPAAIQDVAVATLDTFRDYRRASQCVVLCVVLFLGLAAVARVPPTSRSSGGGGRTASCKSD